MNNRESFNIHIDRSGYEFYNSVGQSLIMFDYKYGYNSMFFADIDGDYKELNTRGSSMKKDKSNISVMLYDVPYYDRYADVYIDTHEGVALMRKFTDNIFFGKCRVIAASKYKENTPWSLYEKLKDLSYEKLPDWDKILHIVKKEDILYCFYCKKFEPCYNMQLLKYDGTTITEGKVESWEVYRDGGTTYSKTNFGSFYFPTSFKPELKPSLDEIEIDVIDITDKEYSIFNLKTENKTLEDVFEDKIKSMEGRCSTRLEKAITEKYGKGFWYSEDYKQSILKHNTIFEFEHFLDTVYEL